MRLRTVSFMAVIRCGIWACQRRAGYPVIHQLTFNDIDWWCAFTLRFISRAAEQERMAAVIATLIHSGDVGPSFATHESLAYAHSTNISGGGRSCLPDFIFFQSTYFLEGSRHSVMTSLCTSAVHKSIIESDKMLSDWQAVGGPSRRYVGWVRRKIVAGDGMRPCLIIVMWLITLTGFPVVSTGTLPPDEENASGGETFDQVVVVG